MELWQIFSIIGFLFLIVEMFTPTYFSLNFAIAAFITALLAVFYSNITALIIIFAGLSLVLLLFLRPILTSKVSKKEDRADEAYIGKIAKVKDTVTPDAGIVTIYDERWNARSLNGELINTGESVKIVKIENLVMYVERV